MKHNPTQKSTCTRALKLLGDYWTLRIISVLRNGEARFCAIQRALENVNPVTLTNRLHKLESESIIERVEENNATVVYRLTKLGTASIPILDAIESFSKKTLRDKN